MQANKLFVMNNIIQRRFFFTTNWKNRRLTPPVEEVLKWKGPRRLKPHRIMWKFLNKAENGTFSCPPVGAPSISLEKAISSISFRRVPVTKKTLVLNKIFMNNITEILATSDIGIPLFGHDIQFCRVRVNPDLSVLNVYWIPQGTEKDEEIQYLLNEVAGPLRQELISLRVMGLVPRIQFVKDKHYSLLAEVTRRLKIADFGDDYVPALKDSDHLREDLQLFTKLPTEIKEKIANLEETESFDKSEEQELPPMRMDTFSFDYDKVLRNVKQGVLKSKTKKQELDDDVFNNPRAIFELPSTAILNKTSWDKKAFKKYIKQRNNKMKKMQASSLREYRELHTPYDEEFNAEQFDFEVYNDFVKYPFEDEVEDSDYADFDDERYEQEQ